MKVKCLLAKVNDEEIILLHNHEKENLIFQ